jgi:hypothetical protein
MVTPVVCLETRQPVISSSMSSTLFCFDNLTEDHRHHRFDCHLRPHRAFPSSKPEVAQTLAAEGGRVPQARRGSHHRGAAGWTRRRTRLLEGSSP